jgi:hypothetical protein
MCSSIQTLPGADRSEAFQVGRLFVRRISLASSSSDDDNHSLPLDVPAIRRFSESGNPRQVGGDLEFLLPHHTPRWWPDTTTAGRGGPSDFILVASAGPSLTMCRLPGVLMTRLSLPSPEPARPTDTNGPRPAPLHDSGLRNSSSRMPCAPTRSPFVRILPTNSSLFRHDPMLGRPEQVI